MIIAVTSDTDFVSDGILECAYRRLEHTPCTLFITARTEYAADVTARNGLWEVEPHPNFLCGSSHGDTVDGVLNAADGFGAQNLGFRCHRYYYSNDIGEKFAERGYKYSSNVCTDMRLVPPFVTRCGLTEFPVFFEDGGYLKYHGAPDIADVTSRMTNADGIYVFNFHPIHIALNSRDYGVSRALKDGMPRERYRALSASDVEKLQNRDGYGISNLLNDLLRYAAESGARLCTLEQIYRELEAADI